MPPLACEECMSIMKTPIVWRFRSRLCGMIKGQGNTGLVYVK